MTTNRSLSLVENNWTTLDEYLSQIDTGHPNELESDNCLDTALLSCDSNEDCEAIMEVDRRSSGYRATHKYSSDFDDIFRRDLVQQLDNSF